MNIQLLAGLSFDDALYIAIVPIFAFIIVFTVRWLYRLASVAVTWLIDIYCVFIKSVIKLWVRSIDGFVDGIVRIEKKWREL